MVSVYLISKFVIQEKYIYPGNFLYSCITFITQVFEHLFTPSNCIIHHKHGFSSVEEMGPDFSPKTAVKSLTSQQIVRIQQLFRQAKFDDPSGDVSRFLLSIASLY